MREAELYTSSQTLALYKEKSLKNSKTQKEESIPKETPFLLTKIETDELVKNLVWASVVITPKTKNEQVKTGFFIFPKSNNLHYLSKYNPPA